MTILQEYAVFHSTINKISINKSVPNEWMDCIKFVSKEIKKRQEGRNA